jgi:ABC-2 type transport system permease protein
MNTHSDAMAASPLAPQGIAPAVLSATRPFYWSMRRELWENRSVYIAPLAVAAVFLFGFLISMITLPQRLRTLSTLDPMQQVQAVESPFALVAGLLMVTQMLVGIFYSLDALHGERRDRSILFWKSMPVSDLTAVLSKAAIPIVVLPLFTFALTVVTQLIMLLLSSPVVLGSSAKIAPLWNQLAWWQMSLGLLYHLVVVHGLWHAPLYGWLLLVSGWARRMVFVWAAIPPLAIGIIEKAAFNTSHFGDLVGYQLQGPGQYSFTVPYGSHMDPTMALGPLRFLAAPGLWTGLALTALFLALTVRMRRYRGPI